MCFTFSYFFKYKRGRCERMWREMWADEWCERCRERLKEKKIYISMCAHMVIRKEEKFSIFLESWKMWSEIEERMIGKCWNWRLGKCEIKFRGEISKKIWNSGEIDFGDFIWYPLIIFHWKMLKYNNFELELNVKKIGYFKFLAFCLEPLNTFPKFYKFLTFLHIKFQINILNFSY